VQGYIYAKPLTVGDARALLARGLSVVADGPRSARPVRQTMLRKIWLEHAGEKYEATIRNISQTGALVTGLWNVPSGTIFTLELGVGQTVTVTTRWCKEDRMGIEFARPLDLDENGRIILMPEQKRNAGDGLWLRKAG